MELNEALVVLSEGEADKKFLTAMMKSRPGYPAFDAPFPNELHHGNTSFGKMLSAIQGDPRGFSRVRGVLIVADSGTTPAVTFGAIQRQIAGAGGYPVPAAAEAVTNRTGTHPAVAVMLVPDPATGGGLESLCVAEILSREPWAAACVDAYLQCGQMDAHTWGAEKRDKARYHCLVAGLNHEDPSKAVSAAFWGASPLISVQNNAFDAFAGRLKTLCNQLLA